MSNSYVVFDISGWSSPNLKKLGEITRLSPWEGYNDPSTSAAVFFGEMYFTDHHVVIHTNVGKVYLRYEDVLMIFTPVTEAVKS